MERHLEQQMDLRFWHFEERFEEIVDRLDVLGIDAHRRRNDDRRPGAEMAFGDPIGRPIPVRRQPAYDEDSEEESDPEPNRFGRYPP